MRQPSEKAPLNYNDVRIPPNKLPAPQNFMTCPICVVKPRYQEGHKIMPFCGRDCLQKFTIDIYPLCLHCNVNPRAKSAFPSGKDHVFCSLLCSKGHAILPDAQIPAVVNENPPSAAAIGRVAVSASLPSLAQNFVFSPPSYEEVLAAASEDRHAPPSYEIHGFFAMGAPSPAAASASPSLAP